MKNLCTSCGMAIMKSATRDSHLCRTCEKTMTQDELYAHLDMR